MVEIALSTQDILLLLLITLSHMILVASTCMYNIMLTMKAGYM